VVVYTDTVGSTSVPALRSDGIETTMVFAVVTDAVGHRVREGVAVDFSTNLQLAWALFGLSV
jgi:hypothetical protein